MYEKNAESPAAREGQIPSGLMRLENCLEDAEKTLSALADRLQPISRNEPPSATKDAKVVEALTPIAERIRRATERVSTLSAYMSSITGRLEL